MHTEQIVPATPADIPALNSLVNSAYRGESSKQGWTTEADLLDGVRTTEQDLTAMLTSPTACILTLRINQQLKGCVFLDKQGDDLYLGMLTVDPYAQAQGIGRRLIEAAENYALDHHCNAVVMTVITLRHELIAWYERRGYQRTGILKPFPKDPSFGTPRKELSFEVLRKGLKSV
ncbi:GNAT family N-acetyltransferase [Arsenicibacter rosenii]|uniref:GNAT family N-acetyltransferase n=1 Tax=Arsenicibacter rosenii TaxID=1750698 RepID=A0A1S2VK93_9BACT|nr:GNAT family N-acetyltransferase [Arsenicibacter rosenii]OIN59182.1 GNAT family N-acetyltransferase [Arsenicibacter rosenii]